MDIYRTLGSRSLSVTALLNFSGKANTSIHGLGGDDKANCRPAREAPETQMTKNKRHNLIYKQDGIIIYFQRKGRDKKLIANGTNLTFSGNHRGADPAPPPPGD